MHPRYSHSGGKGIEVAWAERHRKMRMKRIMEVMDREGHDMVGDGSGRKVKEEGSGAGEVRGS